MDILCVIRVVEYYGLPRAKQWASTYGEEKDHRALVYSNTKRYNEVHNVSSNQTTLYARPIQHEDRASRRLAETSAWQHCCYQEISSPSTMHAIAYFPGVGDIYTNPPVACILTMKHCVYGDALLTSCQSRSHPGLNTKVVDLGCCIKASSNKHGQPSVNEQAPSCQVWVLTTIYGHTNAVSYHILCDTTFNQTQRPYSGHTNVLSDDSFD